MEWYSNYRLIEDGDGFTLEIQLDNDSSEFADEFLAKVGENVAKLDDKIKKLIKENFSDIKINSVKLLAGTIIVATIPFYGISAAAATTTPTSITQTVGGTYTVTASSLNVRTGPSTTNPIMHTLWYGNQVKVIGESGNWYNIQLSDGRTGWASKDYLAPQTDMLGTVTVSKLNVRTGASTTNAVLTTLVSGAQVQITGSSGDWYVVKLSDGRTGYASKAYLHSISAALSQQEISKVLATAKSLLGTPYVYGGESPQEGGFDCSGLTQYVYKQVGIALNRVSTDQSVQGISVSPSALQPGDLMFYSFNMNGVVDHVGIYIGNGQMIHSPKTGDVVKVADISVAYWQQRLVTTRRMIY